MTISTLMESRSGRWPALGCMLAVCALFTQPTAAQDLLPEAVEDRTLKAQTALEQHQYKAAAAEYRKAAELSESV